MKNLVVLDCEVYPNYTLFAFKNVDNKKIITLEIKGEDSSLDIDDLKRLLLIMKRRTTLGFNSRNYDMCIILAALKQKTAKEIYNLSKFIIEGNSVGWQTMQKFNLIPLQGIKHFDIQEVAPGVKVSLKLYGARLNSLTLKDLPIEPGTILSDEDCENIKKYCINDLDTTIDLFNSIKERVQLRFDMSEEYKEDLLSKSDAQIAESVIKSQLRKKAPYVDLRAPKILPNTTFKYKAPKYIKFKTAELQDLLEKINNCNFGLDEKGSVKLPDEIKKTKIELGNSKYQLGIGGLHSNEKKKVTLCKKSQILADRDVASYYPNIILNLNLYPRHLGEQFLKVYDDIVKKRLKAKEERNKIVNESLKIVINGSFGKLGNKYSCLYSPDLMIAVTLTGQLALLMLIEELELKGISVISANTDGFVSLMEKDKYELYDSVCFKWELLTGFDLEETRYCALYSRDVNNYLAITNEGKTKGKGIFTLESISKNPAADICIEAVVNYLQKGKEIQKYIYECKDLTKFLTVRSVTGGAVWKEEYLGRVVRWIYSTNGDVIKYKKNGNKVPKSDGSRPIMTLGEFPSDINYPRYIEESISILESLGINYAN